MRRIPVGVREEETRLENGMIDCVSHSYFLELSLARGVPDEAQGAAAGLPEEFESRVR